MKKPLGAAALVLCVAAVAGAVGWAAPALITLPTQWRIVPASGPVATVGTLPTGVVLSRDGTRLIELESGHRKPALRVLDAVTLREIRSVPLSGAYGV
ncbi:MAG: hypothetical protein JOZ24_09055, partial [Candidatus Eremiobacteraeota bacterium]|nr:hypothetical protein [Candidatus Eremiobacteraeota bacterium]